MRVKAGGWIDGRWMPGMDGRYNIWSPGALELKLDICETNARPEKREEKVGFLG